MSSVDQVISWWGGDPQPAQMPALMKALLYRGEARMAVTPALAEADLRHAAVLAADPRMAAALDMAGYGASSYNESYYDDIANQIQADLIVLRYRGIPGRVPDPAVLKDRCQAVAVWPPAWMKDRQWASRNLSLACQQAYMQQFNVLPPEATPVVVDGIVAPIQASPQSAR